MTILIGKYLKKDKSEKEQSLNANSEKDSFDNDNSGKKETGNCQI